MSSVVRALDRRRDAVLADWRLRVQQDPKLADSSKLTRTQFEDHVPWVLDALSRRLLAIDHGVDATRPPTREERMAAAEHGGQRWQQGYDQRQTLREWRHLQLALLDALDAVAARVRLPSARLDEARRAIAVACMDGAEESVNRYSDMKQAEAASRISELERAIAQLGDIESQRLVALREAAHDLRGNVATLRTASAVLAHQSASESARSLASVTIQRGVRSLHELLNELLDLSRLEAGLERRRVEPFDAAAVLGELCRTLVPVAEERGLYLRHAGPPTLPVLGDAVKVMRIAQNLIHNALRYTPRGGVRVEWRPPDPAGKTVDRWQLVVSDTGPGLSDASASPISREIRAATEEADRIGAGSGEAPAADASHGADDGGARGGPTRHARPEGGEGLGLTIVKRLCELLDASIELKTGPGEGTTFVIALPVRYDGPAVDAASPSPG
jgi:signal transduction histidine kinase